MVSHPHYYTTYVEWWEAFKCPIYVGSDDQEWLCRKPPPSKDVLRFIQGPAGCREEIVKGVTAIKTGGHFPGSLVLHWGQRLFIADTIVTVPVCFIIFRFSLHDIGFEYILTRFKSAYTPHPRPQGQTTYAFQWSIPNMIPLPPSEIFKIWQAIRLFDFDTTHGAFVGMDVSDSKLKERMLESMKIQVRGEGWKEHEILRQTIE